MAETAAKAEQAPERAAPQPVNDAVQNFAPPEKSTTWSDVASQCWNGDFKDCTSAVGKALRESLGFGNSEKQKELEETGVLPKTRISESSTEGKSPQFTVEWGEKPLQKSAQRNAGDRRAETLEGEEGSRPKLELVKKQGEGPAPTSGKRALEPVTGQANLNDVGRRADGESDQPAERHRPGRKHRNGERDGATDRSNNRNGDRTGESERAGVKVESDGELGKVYELKLDHNTGRHKVDASVIVPKGYNPEKPTRMLIYNHGFRTDAKAALDYSELKDQMRSADPQTVLVVPEWQAKPGSESSARGRSDQPGFYKGMLNEVMQKTPELQGKNVDNLASIGIIAHSAGYNPAMAQLYKNGLGDKITSVTVLDSMYNQRAYDGWITDNLKDLAAGRKHFQLIYTGHLANQSVGLQQRVERQLANAGLGTDSVYKDHSRGSGLVSPETMAQHGFVFKRSDFTNRGDGAHGAMTHVYLRQLLNSEKRNRR